MDKNKTYIIYSLFIPFIWVLLFIININFGVFLADNASRPLGQYSDYITTTVKTFYLIFGIIHIILYFINFKNRSLKNTFMLLLNLFFGFCSFAASFMAIFLLSVIILIMLGGFLLIIGYLALYGFQIYELIKIIKEK